MAEAGYAGPEPTDESGPTVAALPNILMQTSRDIASALNSLYRSHEFLKQAAVQRLTRTRGKLTDLSSTTEDATHRILDGLDSALVLIEELSRTEAGDPHATERVQGLLREEVHGLITALQFQDIVAQQIAFATRVLEDTEGRVQQVAEQLEKVFGQEAQTADHGEALRPFDPGASTLDSSEQQGLADSIFNAAALGGS